MQTIYCFDIFLKDLEEDEILDVHLSDLLVFVTGADAIPPLGFDRKIKVEFYDVTEEVRRLPSSSTCALTLHLPRGIADTAEFKEMLLQSLKEGHGFGKC